MDGTQHLTSKNIKTFFLMAEGIWINLYDN